MTSIQTLSKRFCELAEREWHEIEIHANGPKYPGKCSCGYIDYLSKDLQRHIDVHNPDFSDAWEVLKALKRLGVLEEFLRFLIPDGVSGIDVARNLIPRCTDTTGLLLAEAVKFLEGREKGNG